MFVSFTEIYKFVKYMRSHLTYFNFQLSNYLLWFFVILLFSSIFGITGGILSLVVSIGLIVLLLHIGISVVHIIKDYVYVKDISIYSRYILVYLVINLVLCFLF